jgi:hypothetical protein
MALLDHHPNDKDAPLTGVSIRIKTLAAGFNRLPDF